MTAPIVAAAADTAAIETGVMGGIGATETSTAATASQVGATAMNAGNSSAVAKILDYVGGSSLSEGLSPLSTIFNMILTKKSADTQAEQFDLQFEENKRRFGLEYALREYSLRKGFSMQQAREAYAQRYGAAMNVGAIKSANNTRLNEEEKMRWAREDRAKVQKMQSLYSRGFLTGLFGRK